MGGGAVPRPSRATSTATPPQSSPAPHRWPTSPTTLVNVRDHDHRGRRQPGGHELQLRVYERKPESTAATPTELGEPGGDRLHGTAISAAQRNATASVPGAFAYSPVSGTVLAAGSHTLSVTFTPTDPGYSPITPERATVTLVVAKAVLTVTAANQIASPTARRWRLTRRPSLGYVNGDTSSVVNGTPSLTTSPATPVNVGTYTITAAAGTLAASNYSFAFSNGTLTITSATPTLTWANPANITYGTALSATQLNATASVPGAFAYSPVSGTVLAAGSHTLSVTFTPTDPGYSPQTATVTLVVTKAVLTVTAANQTITYGTTVAPYTATIAGYVNGDPSTVVNGAASLTTSPATPVNVGSYTITAALGTLAASNYSFAFSNGTLTITAATPTLTWANPASITYGTALSATQLNATASVPGAFAYSPVSGTVLAAGNNTLSVTFTPRSRLRPHRTRRLHGHPGRLRPSSRSRQRTRPSPPARRWRLTRRPSRKATSQRRHLHGGHRHPVADDESGDSGQRGELHDHCGPPAAGGHETTASRSTSLEPADHRGPPRP